MSIKEKMTAIANAIRSKTGKAELLTLDDMANEIPNVYEAGAKSEYDRFWDAFQNNGTRTSYGYGFYGSGAWDINIFKPKYDITEGEYCFNYFLNGHGTPLDLIKLFNELGIKFNNAKKWSYANYMFRGADITTCPKVHISCPQYVFYNCKNLVTIEELSLTKGEPGQTLTGGTTKNNFYGCTKLENLKIGGTIPYDFDVSPCIKLTYESLISIKNALYDFSGSSKTYTLTVGSTNLAKYTETDIEEIKAKGWSVV